MRFVCGGWWQQLGTNQRGEAAFCTCLHQVQVKENPVFCIWCEALKGQRRLELHLCWIIEGGFFSLSYFPAASDVLLQITFMRSLLKKLTIINVCMYVMLQYNRVITLNYHSDTNVINLFIYPCWNSSTWDWFDGAVFLFFFKLFQIFVPITSSRL